MSLMEMMMQNMGGDALGQISSQLGADRKQTGSAITQMLPMLLGALANNSRSDDGAESLRRALEKDHDGSIFENLGGFLNNPQAGPGDGILRHVLGRQRPAVEADLATNTGMDPDKIGSLMTMLAPLLMGALGKSQRDQGYDARNLSQMLERETQSLERPESGGGLLAGLLDQDGDGDFDASDLAKTGLGLVSKFLRR